MAYKTKKREPRPGEGRPSKYKEEYCDMLVKHMASGLSFESFAGVVSVARITIYEWEQAYPEFSYSKKLGTSKSLDWWEREGQKGLWNDKDGPTLNNAVWIFNMKNRHGWKDRIEQEVIATAPITLTYDPKKNPE